MKQLAGTYPLQAFQYGFKHQYNDLIDLTAPFAMDLPIEEVCKEIPIVHQFAWLKYDGHWRRAIDKALDKYSEPISIRCRSCRRVTAIGSLNVRVNQPSSPQSLRDYLRRCYPEVDLCPDCGCHEIIPEHNHDFDDVDRILWAREPFPYTEALRDLDHVLMNMPAFTTFL
ncbi:hypothetical protein H0H93_013449 [Arthromyces matolae]|nr:hypothetical protein H0H93_013449 [Arthromyces matolae]